MGGEGLAYCVVCGCGSSKFGGMLDELNVFV